MFIARFWKGAGSSFVVYLSLLSSLIAQIDGKELVDKYIQTIPPFEASWEIDKRIQPDPKLVAGYDNQIASYTATSGGLSLDALKGLREYHSKSQQINETTSLTYYSDLRFNGVQIFKNISGDVSIAITSPGNGLVYAKCPKTGIITITGKPPATAAFIGAGQVLFLLRKLVSEMSDYKTVANEDNHLTLQIRSKDGITQSRLLFSKLPFRILSIDTTIDKHSIYKLESNYTSLEDDLPHDITITTFYGGNWALQSVEVWKLTNYKLLMKNDDSALSWPIEKGYTINDMTGAVPVTYPSETLLDVKKQH